MHFRGRGLPWPHHPWVVVAAVNNAYCIHSRRLTRYCTRCTEGDIHCSCIGCLPTAVVAVAGNGAVVGTFAVVDNVDTKLHCCSQVAVVVVAVVALLMLKVAN